ncbi:hypothetical protein IMZ48_32270 [Candidatus Bathyarchaeota archaeon]|nr:hypothetical protein [Candidatus Bathyarchaeota archaeon]
MYSYTASTYLSLFAPRFGATAGPFFLVCAEVPTEDPDEYVDGGRPEGPVV